MLKTHPDAIAHARARLDQMCREVFSANPPPRPHSIADQAAIDPHDGEALYAGWDALRDRWAALNGLKRTGTEFNLDALVRFLPSGGRWGKPYAWPEAGGACDHPSYFRWKRLATAMMVEPYVPTDFEALLVYAPKIGLVAHVPPNPLASFWAPGSTHVVVLTRPAFGDIRWLPDQLNFEVTLSSGFTVNGLGDPIMSNPAGIVAGALQRLEELEAEHDLGRDPSPLFGTKTKTDLARLRRYDEASFIKLMDRWKAEGVPQLAELRKSLDKHARTLDDNYAVRMADNEYGLTRGKDGEVVVSPDKEMLPQIQMVEANLPEVIAQSEKALIAAHADVFQSVGRLVTMYRHDAIDDADNTDETLTEAERGKLPLRRDHGALIIGDIGARALLLMLAKSAWWFKWAERRHAWVPGAPKIEYALHLMEQPGWKLRVLKGTIEAPTLRATGSVLQRPGYDRRSQLFFDAGGVTFDEVPEHPTREQARAALEHLKGIIKDFPFVYDDDYSEASAGRSVALSAMLTGLVRRTLETAPAHAFDAPQAGSGKSKLTEIAAGLMTGSKPTMISQGASPEEFNKRLFSVLRSGDPVIGVDNIDHEIESDELCTALTSPVAQGRILGESRTATVNTNALIIMNGNNLVFKGDITDRTVICRPEPGVEDPKARKFDREPVAHTLANRPELVIAGLTVLRAHVVAGYPGQEGLRPSRFPDWDRVVRGALVWLGESDPQQTANSLKVVDPERDELRALMRAWEATMGLKAKVTAKQLLDRANADTSDTDNPDEDLREAIDLVLPRASTPKALGQYLAKAHNKIAGGRAIRMRPDTKSAAVFWLEEA